MEIKEGTPAPQFTLEDQNGKNVSLKDFKGNNVILYFYPRDNTPGCTKEACCFRDNLEKFEAKNTVILGVSPDNGAAHQNFIDKFNLPFTLLSDPDKKVLKTYGAYGEKTSYGKTTIGVIRSTVWIDPDQKVKKHWKKVANAENHPQEVLEAINSENL